MLTALLDVQMPGADGLTAAAALRAELPTCRVPTCRVLTCRVLTCTTFGRPGYLARAMAAGAAGFIAKDAPPEQLATICPRRSARRVPGPAPERSASPRTRGWL